MDNSISDSALDSQSYMTRIQNNYKDHAELQGIALRRDDSILFDMVEQLQTQRKTNEEKKENEQERSPQKRSQHREGRTSIQNRQNMLFGLIAAGRVKKKNSIANERIETQTNNCPLEESTKNSKLIKAISLLVNVKGFYRQVTKNSRILQRLSKFEHDSIGDVATDSNYFQFSNHSHGVAFSVTIMFLSKILQSIPTLPLFQPFHVLKLFWDFCNSLSILAVLFLTSLEVFFLLPAQSFSFVSKISLFFFIFDILVSANTGFLLKGSLITSRSHIFITYFRKSFFLDSLSLIPIILMQLKLEINHSWITISYALFLLKGIKLRDTWERLHFFLSYQKNMKNFSDLIQLIFLIVSVCHIFSLLWHGLALLEINMLGKDNTWLHAYHLIDQDIFQRYIASFYYMATTMITVGYGDITPKNSMEITFIVFTMFVTGTIWAFFLTTIGSIIGNIEGKNKMYNNNMQIIHGLMRHENVDSSVRLKISNYLEYLYKESNEAVRNQEKEIISKLSEQLRNDLIQDIQGKYIRGIPIIDKLQERKRIALLMEECLFSPGECIFKEEDSDDCSLYYLVRGQVKLTFSSKSQGSDNIVLATLEKSSYFGEIAFLTGNHRTLTAIAHDFCRVFKIRRSQFLEAIKSNEQDVQNFQMMREAITIKDNFKFCQIRCFICKRGNHLSINCPRSHLVMSTQGIIYRHSYSVSHENRLPFKRKMQKFQALSNRHNIIDGVFDINNEESMYEILDNLEKEFHFNLSQMSSQDQESIFAYDDQSLYTLQNQRANKYSLRNMSKSNAQRHCSKSSEHLKVKGSVKSSNQMNQCQSDSGSMSDSVSSFSGSMGSFPDQKMKQSHKTMFHQSNLIEEGQRLSIENSRPSIKKSPQLRNISSLPENFQQIDLQFMKDSSDFPTGKVILTSTHKEGSNNSLKRQPSRMINEEHKANSFNQLLEHNDVKNITNNNNNKTGQSQQAPQNKGQSQLNNSVKQDKIRSSSCSVSYKNLVQNQVYQLSPSKDKQPQNEEILSPISFHQQIETELNPSINQGQQTPQFDKTEIQIKKRSSNFHQPNYAEIEYERKQRNNPPDPRHITQLLIQATEHLDNLQQEQKEEVEYLMLLQFESCKIFKFYWPQFNYPSVIERWQIEHCKRNESFLKKKKAAKKLKNKNAPYPKKPECSTSMFK